MGDSRRQYLAGGTACFGTYLTPHTRNGALKIFMLFTQCLSMQQGMQAKLGACASTLATCAVLLLDPGDQLINIHQGPGAHGGRSHGHPGCKIPMHAICRSAGMRATVEV